MGATRPRIPGARPAWNGRLPLLRRRRTSGSRRSSQRIRTSTRTRRSRSLADVHPVEPALQHQFESMEQQKDASSLGMWVFLVTEILFFGGLFLTYTIYRWENARA